MDRAQFELIGNVGKLEFKTSGKDKKFAIISLATSERWKPDGSSEWIEKTYWHRVVVFAPGKVSLIEAAVQKGTRLRLVGQVRPSSWEDERGHTRYSIEFVVTGGNGSDVEILARGKPKAAESEEKEPAAKARKTTRGKMAAAGDAPAA